MSIQLEKGKIISVIKQKIERIPKQEILKGVKQKLSSLSKNIEWKSPKTIGTLVLGTIVLASGISLGTITTYAVSVSVNGEQLGYASNQSQAEEMIAGILAKHGEGLGVTAQTGDNIAYKKAWISKKELLANSLSEDKLLSAITPYVEGYGLDVNGEVIAILPSEKEIDQVLADYKEYLTKPSETNQVFSAEYEEAISKKVVQASLADVKTADAALEMLKEGSVTTVEYTIEKNDSLWSIARKNNMYTQEILDANPEITEETILQLGQVLKLSTVEPYLTVVSKGQKTVTETIPFNVETKTDYSLAAGKRVVKQAGQDGEKEVSYTYTEENGKAVEKTVIKETVITEPVKQVIAQGPARATVTVSSSRGSGSVSGLSRPISGKINSYYGYRGGEFHTGVDFNGSVGQPYSAAAGGKVIAAGWHGNYGKMILIDHGNGVVTRYAHSSQLLVSAGDTVSKGQTIGYVGVTGRTSGAHLHFELIINGNTVNPLNYL